MRATEKKPKKSPRTQSQSSNENSAKTFPSVSITFEIAPISLPSNDFSLGFGQYSRIDHHKRPK
jgi:hypothetical protein